MRYVSFADESYLGDFKSIAAFSLRENNLDEVNLELNDLLRESNVKEFKWQKLKNAKYEHCARKIIDSVWKLISKEDARIDVITWNIKDSRHDIKKRDDTANYGRMFFHLHSKSLKRRPKLSEWRLYPDEGVGIDWPSVQSCLNAVGQRRDRVELSLLGTFFSDPYYRIHTLREVKSHEEPCCQVADLFAGMSVFSRVHYSTYEKWREYKEPSLPLFTVEEPSTTGAERARFPVLQYLDQGCKSRKLGVSLKTKRYLNTPNPANPINFWPYTPQHEMDKAPTKGG